MIRYPGKCNVKEEGVSSSQFQVSLVVGNSGGRNSRLQVNLRVASRGENKELTYACQVLISFSHVFVVNFRKTDTVYFILSLSKSPLDSLKLVLCSLPGCVKAQETVFCDLFCLNIGVLWTFPQGHFPPLLPLWLLWSHPFLVVLVTHLHLKSQPSSFSPGTVYLVLSGHRVLKFIVAQTEQDPLSFL